MPTHTVTHKINRNYKWAVTSRVMAAIFGGYFFTLAASVFYVAVSPFMFGISRAQSAHNALFFSFIFYLLIIMLVFSTRSAKKAWLWVVSLTILLSSIGYGIDGVPF